MKWIQCLTHYKLCHVELYGRVYIDNIDANSGFDAIVVINKNGKTAMILLLHCQ